jgi:hypothetical protein
MSDKPDNWDPKHPADRLCIFCYARAPYYAVWRYGVNCTCYEGKCKTRTKGMVGFEGIYRKKSEADARFTIMDEERRAKDANKRGKR